MGLGTWGLACGVSSLGQFVGKPQLSVSLGFFLGLGQISQKSFCQSVSALIVEWGKGVVVSSLSM